jgi:hypothetical protein
MKVCNYKLDHCNGHRTCETLTSNETVEIDGEIFIQMEFANEELPNLDICLVHTAFNERWIPHLMIYVCLGVCGLILGITTVSHLSHEVRDTKGLL